LIVDPPIDWNPVWSPAGDEMYFLSDRGGTMNLWRVPVRESSGAAAGEISPVTLPAVFAMHFTAAANGRVFAFVQGQQETALYAVDFDAARQQIDGKIVPVIAGTNARSVYNFSFSPDGRQLVHDTIGEAQEDIWIVDLDGSRPRRLTSDNFNDRTPAWSPNGREILFFSDRSGTYEEWSIQVDGSGLRQLTRTGRMQRSIWSPDGSRIIAARLPGSPAFLNPNAGSVITEAPPAPGLNDQSGTVFFNWPNGTPVLVGEQVAVGNGRLVLYWLADGRVEPLGISGRRPVLLPGARQFVFSRGSECFLYDVTQRRERLLFSVAPNKIYAIDVSRPGRIYFTQTLRKGDIWLGRMDQGNK
jgi:WD40 repeat protein